MDSPVPAPAPPPAQAPSQQSPQPTDELNGLEQQVQGMSLVPGAAELHRACGEGNVDEVRAVLSRGLEHLESLDMSTGCTPIVLAIRNNHADVVRELLSAGAIVPPPGLTSDPLMLSLLYPQPMFGNPHFMPPPDFFSPGPHHQHQQQQQGGYYPDRAYSRQQQQQQQQGAAAGKDGSNLPPADVAKTIPCRNFPNCKYGQGCVFYHPTSPPPFVYRGHHHQGFDAYGYPQQQPMYMQQANGFPYHLQMAHQQPQPEQQQISQEQSPAQDAQPQPQSQDNNNDSITNNNSNDITHDHTQPIASQPVSAGAAPFIPSGFAQSPPPPSQYGGLSPLSPSMLASSLPSIPPAEAFFAASPPNVTMLPLYPPAHHRQSFGQAAGMPRPYGHGKKPSFSGGPRPFRSGGGAPGGSWKDGNPPPCAFFVQGKCRNGEFCKFPHLDAEGNDCRHPDVVRGILPPLPSLSRQPRGMRMMPPPPPPMDPRQQQLHFLQQQRSAVQAQQTGEAPLDPTTINTITTETSSPVQGEGVTASASAPATAPATHSDRLPTTLHPSVPPKPPTGPMPQIVRSASQPGVQRVHANGLNSRSHSPAPSNVSFHGNGHPRRGTSRPPYVNGTANGRSVSGEQRQRVPGADEFPALGGMTTSPSGSQVLNGKTAAQVLSGPAPTPAAPKVVVDKNSDEQSDGENSVTMSSEPDSDAVLITHKPSAAPSDAATQPSSADPSAASSPKKAQSSLSFASAVAPPSAEPIGVSA